MENNIIVESLPQLGVCNLCLNEGAVKSMLVSHEHHGETELYTEMLQKCFAIDLSVMELGDSKRVICDTCAARLRDSVEFKQQVQQSLATLVAAWKLHKDTPIVKQELEDLDTFFDMTGNVMDNDDADDDYIPHFEIKSPIKKEETPVKKSKNTSKPKKYSRKHPHDIHETEKMLESGLFPFKIRKNKTFCCSVCPETGTSLDELKTHICQHTKTNIHHAFNKMMLCDSHIFFKMAAKLRCKICTADVTDYQELKQHIEKCTLIKYIPLKLKWNHLPFKLEKDQLDCPICKKRFLNFVSLNTHMNVHYPNYICENCGKAFASKARLRGHMRTHEEGQFPCRYCDAVFDRVTKRENHVSKEHKAGVRYACKRCNISLNSFYARQKHLAEVHNEELKRYKCKACPQSYITPGHLSSHVRRDHLNERNHKCDKCDLAFYTKNALKMHMIKHDGERIHVCNVCQKSYQRKKTLREHMRIHDNDKRFVCPVCGRAFTQKCTLKGHLRVHDRKVELDDESKPLHSI